MVNPKRIKLTHNETEAKCNCKSGDQCRCSVPNLEVISKIVDLLEMNISGAIRDMSNQRFIESSTIKHKILLMLCKRKALENKKLKNECIEKRHENLCYDLAETGKQKYLKHACENGCPRNMECTHNK